MVHYQVGKFHPGLGRDHQLVTGVEPRPGLDSRGETSYQLLKPSRRIYLDLGSVNVMAAITVNGKTSETLWRPPFKTDITQLLNVGQNKLKVKVTSTNPCQSPGMIGPVRLTVAEKKEFSEPTMEFDNEKNN